MRNPGCLAADSSRWNDAIPNSANGRVPRASSAEAGSASAHGTAAALVAGGNPHADAEARAGQELSVLDARHERHELGHELRPARLGGDVVLEVPAELAHDATDLARALVGADRETEARTAQVPLDQRRRSLDRLLRGA